MNKAIVSVVACFAALFAAGVTPAKEKPSQAATGKAAEAQVVEMSVTKAGFVPAQVKVKVGKPVKLMITRKTDHTCAKDIVIKDYGIKQPLPLDQTVEVAFTPTKAGSSRFACAMDMIAGTIIVE